MTMYGIPKYFAHSRAFYICIRLKSTEKQTHVQSTLRNPENISKEPIFHHSKAQLNADIKGNQFSFEYQTTTKLNYDIWRWLYDLLETISKRKKLLEAKTDVFKLMSELRNVRNARDGIYIELEELQKSLKQNSIEKQAVVSEGYASSELLRLSVNKNDSQKTENRLSVLLKETNIKEQDVFCEFVNAVNLSFEMEKLHSRFLKALIFVGVIGGSLITALGFYVYNFNLINNQLFKSRNETLSQESWGSYLKSYVRPLYSWALPKK